MKRFLALTLTLILFLGACAAPVEFPIASPLPPATVEAAVATLTPAPPAPASTVTQAAPAPQATSRGDKLVASDPASVQVGAGNPVLLEFFRFT